MTAIRLVSTRKIENGDLRALIFIGDSMARDLFQFGRTDINDAWTSCVQGVRRDREFLAPLIFVGNSMAEQLGDIDNITAKGVSLAWYNTAKRVAK